VCEQHDLYFAPCCEQSKFKYDLYLTLQSAKYNTNKRKKEEGTDRQIYTVVAHINVSHEQIG